MDYREIKINWQKIDIPWILFTNFDWRKLSTSDQSRNLEGLHCRVVSPTFARVRVITIEWVIEKIDWIEKVAERINHLQNIFSLQTNLVELEEKELYIKDIFWNEWKILVKIKEPFEFYEDTEMKGSHYNFRVVLESTKSPIYKSFEENSVESSSSDFGWFYLDFELEKAFDESSWALQVNILWNVSVPLRFELVAVSTVIFPITIRNLKTEEFFKIENLPNFKLWDKIIIDSENFSLLLNDENIIEKRASWSTWLKASWSSIFLVTDSSSSMEEKILSRVYFSNSML